MSSASRCLTGSLQRGRRKIFPGRPGIAPCFDHGNSEYMMIQLETWWYHGDSINNILIIFPLYQQKKPVYPSYPHDIPMIYPDLVWLVVWNIFYLSIQLGIIIIPTGPSSPSFFRGVGLNHQPAMISPNLVVDVWSLRLSTSHASFAGGKLYGKSAGIPSDWINEYPLVMSK